jgi:hypothetical protein
MRRSWALKGMESVKTGAYIVALAASGDYPPARTRRQEEHEPRVKAEVGAHFESA